jgi:hypothetical protein
VVVLSAPSGNRPSKLGTLNEPEVDVYPKKLAKSGYAEIVCGFPSHNNVFAGIAIPVHIEINPVTGIFENCCKLSVIYIRSFVILTIIIYI